MARIKVAVSPFFGGEEWTDEGTGITFKKAQDGSMAIYSIPEDKDLSGIRKAVQINALYLVEGSLEDVKQEKKVEAKAEVKETPKKETKAEAKKEVKAETKKEETTKVEAKDKEPKAKTETKKAPSRKRSTSSKSNTKK